MRQWIAFSTLFHKELVRCFRIWRQTLLPSVVTSVLYFLIFGSFIGSQINDINGYSYMAFIVPGLIMMSIITNSYANVSASFFGSKFQKSIEELLVSPASENTIILGFVAGGVTRSLIVGGLVALVSIVFVPLHVHNVFIIFLFALLTSILFSLAGMLNGLWARNFDDIGFIPSFVLTPLTYLGGVFYSIAALPAVWQTVSKANPVLYLVNGLRYGFLGVSDINVWVSLVFLTVFTIVQSTFSRFSCSRKALA
jgi:ABC-2 type transport system permease protein